MHLDVFKLRKCVNVPVGAAEIVLTHRVLREVNLLVNFDCVARWDQHDLAELAKHVSLIRHADRQVVNLFLVEVEKFVGLTRHQSLASCGLRGSCHLFIQTIYGSDEISANIICLSIKKLESKE